MRHTSKSTTGHMLDSRDVIGALLLPEHLILEPLYLDM